MTTPVQDVAERLVVEAEAALGRLEALPAGEARAAGESAVQGLLDLYGEAIRRLAAALETAGGPEAVRAAATDELIGHLMLLHEAHPETTEDRVRRALDEVRPYLGSHGGNVELLALDGGEVHVRLQGSCSSCASSTVTLKLAIEEAIGRLAPEVDRVVAEEAAGAPDAALPGAFIPVESLRSRRETAPAGWRPVPDATGLTAPRPHARDVDGRALVFLPVGADLYAYEGTCPACGTSLESAALDGGELACAGCGERFDARLAGRSARGGDLHLSPVPLLVGADGSVRVAVSGTAMPA